MSSCGYGPPARFEERSAPPQHVLEKLALSCDAAHRNEPRSVIWEKGTRPVKVIQDEEEQTFDTHYVIGGDCIARSSREVWGALHNPLGVQWNESEVQTFERKENEEVDGISYVFLAFQKANPFPRPTWFIQWSHRLIQGTLANPEEVHVVFQKTEGTGFIRHWWGRILFKQVDNETTAAYMEIELKGTRIDMVKCEGAVTSQLNRIRTVPPDLSRFP